jgi:hypothetical protein
MSQVSSGGLGLYDAKENMKELRTKLAREYPAPGESSKIIVAAATFAKTSTPPFGLQFSEEELDNIMRPASVDSSA